MAMSIGSPTADDEVNSTINTTPLVDVMLVLLIIFLITVPVVIKTVPVELPKVTNQPTITKPENVVISVNTEGQIFWNDVLVPDYDSLLGKLRQIAVMVPQPEVHIRGDKGTRFEHVGRVVYACQRNSILKVGFITEPEGLGTGG
jgi:biopolymer transport protein ExbD